MDSLLYIVATPIGTLADFSARAQEVLQSVDFIICEDTRESQKLLRAFHIEKPLESLHLHNEPEKTEYLIKKLQNSPGRSAALISDAGTPCISDPGSHFVKCARDHGVRVLSVPGPSSLVAALSVCGFLQPRHVFSGFMPRSVKDILEEVQRWKFVSPALAVFFESPKRIVDTLTTLEKALGPEVEVCVCRELSKKFEEHITGTVHSVAARLSSSEVRGECVVVVNVEARFAQESASLPLSLEEAANKILTNPEPNLTLKEHAKRVATENKLGAKELYNAVQRLREDARDK